MQFASKCAVFQIFLDKIHLYLCAPFIFKYLGIRIRASGVFTRFVSHFSNKALEVTFMLRQKFQTSYIYLELHFRLFDECVKPILLYCCEVWIPNIINLEKHLGKDPTYKLEELYEDFIPEKVHTKFCKYIIGANKYTTNIAAKGETGRFPQQLMH